MRWGPCAFPRVLQFTPSPLVHFGGTTETTGRRPWRFCRHMRSARSGRQRRDHIPVCRISILQLQQESGASLPIPIKKSFEGNNSLAAVYVATPWGKGPIAGVGVCSKALDVRRARPPGEDVDQEMVLGRNALATLSPCKGA